MTRWLACALLLSACEEDVTPECEIEGTATCESSLVIAFEDGRTGEFRLVVTDDEGLDVQIDCPDLDDDPETSGAYTWFCGQGQVRIEANVPFGSEIRVGVGGVPPVAYTPDYSRGGDPCGNSCNNARIEI